MPATLSYPGVYIKEIPSGVRTIAGVATSITAFVGRTLRGPVNEPVTIQNYGDFERTFGGLWLESSLSFAVRDFYTNGGGTAIIVRIASSASEAAIDLPTGASAPNDVLNLLASNPGEWGNHLSITVDHDTADATDSNLFNLFAEEFASGATETFLNVSIDPDSARFLPIVLAQRSDLIQVKTDSNGAWIMPDTRPSATTTAATSASGTDGSVLTENDYIGSGMQANKEGLYALENADLFSLLCIPPYSLTGDIDPTLVSTAAAYCEDRRAFFIVDPPSSWTDKSSAVSGVSAFGTNSKNAALYFPRLVKPNPLRDNALDTFAPCGAVAGVIARTDAQRGLWKAPAGQEAVLNSVSQLEVPLTDAENGELNPLGVNCLRSFPAAGRVVWGARTLQGNDRLASEWKYVPVRRLALFLEESLYRGTQWVVFEPNDAPLWSQIRLNIGGFMNTLFRQGAFQGSSPREAYLVKCDAETTTQNDIDNGIVNIVVGFAPLKPAEFVVIKIQQMARQTEL